MKKKKKKRRRSLSLLTGTNIKKMIIACLSVERATFILLVK